MCVLANLEYLSILFCLGCCIWFSCCAASVRLSICVWYCHVPGHWLSSGPRQESGPIWAFVVIPNQVDWLFNCWHLGLLDLSPQDAIQMTVTLLSGSTSVANGNGKWQMGKRCVYWPIWSICLSCSALSFGLHGLSCRRSAPRQQRHSHLNDILWRAIKQAQMPAVKCQST